MKMTNLQHEIGFVSLTTAQCTYRYIATHLNGQLEYALNLHEFYSVIIESRILFSLTEISVE